MPEQKVPSVGRTVHYVSYGTPGGEYGAQHRVGIVTEAWEGNAEIVHLCVVNPTGLFFNLHVRYDEECRPGTWHWPEYVPPITTE